MSGDRTDYVAVLDYLYALKPRGTKLGIDRMRPLAAALGNPERAVPCVHVAGTNGKGSVAAMMDAILRAAGWKVGMYTSPHLVELGERVQVDRRILSADKISAYTQFLDSVAEGIAQTNGESDRPSFFEYMTAMAFLEFVRERCDVAVLEVGLGGEFDATNIVRPELSIITSIGLDHCEWLGDTIDKIAQAKAGIIKPGRPVVIGLMPREAEQVIRDLAAARGSRVISVREEFGEDPMHFPTTNLGGTYQRRNAATATLAARSLDERWRLSPEVVHRGLHSARWPGRWERRHIGGRTVILDASHNAEGATVLDAELQALVAETRRAPIVVVGVLGLDRAAALVATICRYAKEIHFVVPQQERAVAYERLESLVSSAFTGAVKRAEVAQIFPGGDVCSVGEAGDVVVVTGSIYLLGEVMTQLK